MCFAKGQLKMYTLGVWGGGAGGIVTFFVICVIFMQAANMMRCEHCGGKHKRIPVDRPWCSARYCDRCNIHHTAKEVGCCLYTFPEGLWKLHDSIRKGRLLYPTSLKKMFEGLK